MNLTPKISVIVPVYKVEEYLHRCIDSILSQSFTDFELILVDDGSPDNCGKICDEYTQKDSRVKVFHKPNGGVSSARNLGLDNAKGEWITFIDADDYIEQKFLDIPLDTSVDLLIQNYKISKDKDYKIFMFEENMIFNSEMRSWINENIAKQICHVPWAKFFKRKIIINKKISFPEGVIIGEDTIFVLDYLYHTKSVQYLSSANYVYIDGGDVCDKYKLPVSKCLDIFCMLIQRYDNLNADSITFLNSKFSLYYSLIHPKNITSLAKWRNDKLIIRICKIINEDYGLEWKLKYILYLIKKRILNIFST